MKVLLTLRPGETRGGFQTVDARTGNLDGIVEAGEATELVALDVLDRFSPRDQPRMLQHWCSRLAPGGIITVGCADLFEVCRGLTNGAFDEQAAIGLLYGDVESRRATLHSELTLSQELRSLGLEVVTARVDGPQCIITARRP